MENEDAKKTLDYIQCTFASLGLNPPIKDDGQFDIIKCKGIISQWVYQGKVLHFDEWRAEVYGDKVERPAWPPQEVMPWPPFEAMRKENASA